MFWITKRATVLMPTPLEGRDDLHHLYIVLSDPSSFSRNDQTIDDAVVVVCICSVPERGVWYDESCKLGAGDHPFVKHDSYIAYRFANMQSASLLKKGVDSGKLKPYAPVEGNVFSYICKGLVISDHTPDEVLEHYKKLYPNE